MGEGLSAGGREFCRRLKCAKVLDKQLLVAAISCVPSSSKGRKKIHRATTSETLDWRKASRLNPFRDDYRGTLSFKYSLRSNEEIVPRVASHRPADSRECYIAGTRAADERRSAGQKALGFAIHELLITPQTLVSNETKGPPGLIDSDRNSGVEWGGTRKCTI